MKIINAIGLVLLLVLSACAKEQPSQPTQVTTPMPTAEEPQTPEQVVVEETQAEAPAEEPKEATANEIQILGKGGFEPGELAISAGSSVTWINKDSKPLTLTVFKDSKFYQNSDVINPNGMFELAFSGKGNYEYWSTAYGVRAKITVE
ncbi:hypothetical protein J4458_00095 [Candidatus Woesearchaeota archaeon]|nr:hypothetical protein [Candidatus Woesearchaeota archaeon]